MCHGAPYLSRTAPFPRQVSFDAFAVFMCPDHNSSGATWLCCAEIFPMSLAKRTFASTSSGVRRRQAELSRFGLPAAETLLHCWPCVDHSLAVPGPGWLYLTQNFVCFLSKMANHTEVIALEHLEQIHKGSSLTMVRAQWCVELVQRGGTRLTFGNLRRRDATLRALRHGRAQAERERKSGLTLWRPLGVRLSAPVTVTNRLPCTMHLLLEPEEARSSHSPLAPLSSPREEAHLPPFRTRELHRVHLLGPARLSVWLDGDTYASARLHAHLDHVTRPTAAEPEEHVLTLHPPQQPHSHRRVRLHVTVARREAGGCTLSVAPQHWAVNNSSLPLDVYEGAAGGGVVLHAHTSSPRPFSLSQEARGNHMAIAW